MYNDLNGKRALVCGASKGIGNAIAQRLASEGVELILLARNEEKLKSMIAELPSEHGQDHRYLVADLSRPDDVLERLRPFISASAPIHIVVNNTGGPAPGPVAEAKLSEFANAFTIHVLSSQAIMSVLLPGMKEAGYGRFVNIISTSVKEPIMDLGVSNTIRAAMGNWSKTLASEVGPFGITVNNVLPGYTDTERLKEIIDARSNASGRPPEETKLSMLRTVPARRFANPDEIASAVTFLCSAEASYVNGINLPVDGGRTKSL